MKKRILSLLLAIAMVVGMLPMPGHVHASEVAPENPVCYCAQLCTADSFNEYCEVCAVDYAACTGTDTAALYADGTIDLSQYSDAYVTITEDCEIIGDGSLHDVALHIVEDATVIFDVGTGGVQLLSSITVADHKTLTLLVKGDAEHIVKKGISLGNGSNVIIEGDLTQANNKLTVTATDGNAGIGANGGVTAGDITIRNARVDATGSSKEVSVDQNMGIMHDTSISGAAIGTSDGSMGDILIENSIIVAEGGYYENTSHAAAIGIGFVGSTMGNITLKDSQITARNNGDGLASVIGAGANHHVFVSGTMGDIIITNTDLNLSMAISTTNWYAAAIGSGIGFSHGYVNMGKIIFTDVTQAELNEIIPTWLPSDFNESSAYALGRGNDGSIYQYDAFGGVYVSDGNDGTKQIGNESGYYISCNRGGFVHDFDEICGGTCRDCDVTYLVVHTEGTAATCNAQAVCSVCGESYGEVDTNAHSYGDWTSNGDGTHTRICAIDSTHTEDGNCSGGTATCTEKAECQHCGASYGEVAGHSTTADGDRAATCTAPAYCSVCKSEYGEVDLSNHDENAAYENGFCVNCEAYEPAQLVEGVYQIANAGNLFWFAQQVNNDIHGIDGDGDTTFVTASAVLTADIDLENRPWTPIGALRSTTDTVGNHFAGTFDGNHKTITGLYVEATTPDSGFFGEIRGATVKNFEISGKIVVMANGLSNIGTIGAVCGQTGTLITGESVVSGITSYVDVVLGDGVTSVSNVGGIAGYANQAPTFENCVWDGTIDLGFVNATAVGGIVGLIRDNSTTIRNCGTYGTITSGGSWGGILGKAQAGTSKIENCFTTASNVCGTENTYVTVNNSFNAADYSAAPAGQIAYLLGEAWGQALGEGGDAYPILGGAKVYEITACDKPAYSNTNANKPHTFDDNGFCVNCDAYEPAQLVDGVYQIANAGQLYWFAQQVNAGNTAINGKLMKDIVVNTALMDKITIAADGTATVNEGEFLRAWTPIGNTSKKYTGTFDGGGKTVSGLYFNKAGTNFVGLFGNVGAGGKVKNVSVDNSYLRGNRYVAAVVGRNTDGTIEKCSNSAIITGNEYVGGIVGYNSTKSMTACVTACYNSGAITGNNRIGGIVGGNFGTVTNCYNTATVSGNTSVGGVTGSNTEIISNCHNTGTVTASTNTGGVTGINSGTVTNCYFNRDNYSGDGIGSDSGTAANVESRTAEQFASGEVAYLLSQGENGDVWGQNIDNGGENEGHPVLSGKTVYYGYTSCADTQKIYTNDSSASDEKPGHTGQIAYRDNGDGTHTGTYSCCGTEITENHKMDTATGKCVCGLEMAVAAVTIGETTSYYENLNDAITAVANCTADDEAVVTLLQNITLNETQDISGGVFTLDLNDKYIKITIEWETLDISGGNTNVTILDSGKNGTIYGGETDNGLYIAEGATVTIRGGSIIGADEGQVVSVVDSTLNINGGEFNGEAFFGSNAVYAERADVNISGGTFSGGQIGVNAMDSTVTITGGIFKGPDNSGVQINGGTANISGGSFDGSFALTVFYGAAVTITGGNFGAEESVFVLDSELTISGGTFSGNYDFSLAGNTVVNLNVGENGVGAIFPGGIKVYDTTLQDILGHGAAYWQNGQQVTVTDDQTEITGGDVVIRSTDWTPPSAGTLGDLDLDGDVDAYDLTALARHVGGIELVEGQSLANADVDGDGDVDAYDLTKHARFVGGIITSWDQE